jgi:hypothetical protein
MLRFGVAVEWIHDTNRGVYSAAKRVMHNFIENAQVWSSGKVDPRLKLLYLPCMSGRSELLYRKCSGFEPPPVVCAFGSLYSRVLEYHGIAISVKNL